MWQQYDQRVSEFIKQGMTLQQAIEKAHGYAPPDEIKKVQAQLLKALEGTPDVLARMELEEELRECNADIQSCNRRLKQAEADLREATCKVDMYRKALEINQKKRDHLEDELANPPKRVKLS
jgi:predicted  nucleic acid-binding Zn-ribbon protein